MKDSDIVRLIKAKNQKGLSHLYDNYSAALMSIIFRTTKDSEVSEEILSQTMLKAWNKINTYDASLSTLFTWLSTIAKNSAIDTKRLKSYQNTRKSEELTSHVYNYYKTSDDYSRLDSDKLIKTLDPKYQIVLQKVYLEGYSQSEIAKELSIPLGTVKTRIRSALKQLRKELRNEKDLFMGIAAIIILYMLNLL